VPHGSQLSFPWQVAKHRKVTEAVHREGGKIALQILHAGRYAYHPFSLAPSPLKAPISPFKPRAMSERQIRGTIRDFAATATLARAAGYDGVEVMGSEGYLINQFICERTNKRTDGWGGSADNRMRFPVEIVRAIRERVGPDFIIIFRLSMLDLVEQGSTLEEVIALGKATIATSVPRGAFSWVTAELKKHLKVPLITTNRINTPEVAERILAQGDADMVSMARPFLADPEFVIKAAEDRADEINTCIACNQACLDHIFKQKRASCLGLLPGQSPRLFRDRAHLRPGAPAQEAGGGGGGPCGPGVCLLRRRARPSGEPVRSGERDRRPVQLRQADPGQGGVSRNPALLCQAAGEVWRRALSRPAPERREPLGRRL